MNYHIFCVLEKNENNTQPIFFPDLQILEFNIVTLFNFTSTYLTRY
jgi:hypothetical protein